MVGFVQELARMEHGMVTWSSERLNESVAEKMHTLRTLLYNSPYQTVLLLIANVMHSMPQRQRIFHYRKA